MKAEWKNGHTFQVTISTQEEKLMTSPGHMLYPCGCCGELYEVKSNVASYICVDCQQPCPHTDCGLKLYEHKDEDGKKCPCEPWGEDPEPEPEPEPTSVVEVGPEPKKRISFNLPAELDEKLRDIAFFTGKTISSIVSRALWNEVQTMEEERGAPFPKRKAK